MGTSHRIFCNSTSSRPSVFLTAVYLLGIFLANICLFNFHRRPYAYAHQLGLRSTCAPTTPAPHTPPASTTVEESHTRFRLPIAATRDNKNDSINETKSPTSSVGALRDPSPALPPGSSILSTAREAAFAFSLLMLLYLGEYRALNVVILTITSVVALSDGLAMARYGNQGWKGAGLFLSEVLLAWLLGRHGGFSM